MAKIFMLMDDPRINSGYAGTNRITIENFKKLGHECVLFSFNGEKRPGEYLGSRIIPHNSLKNENENEVLYGDKNFLLDIYNKENPDILFFHNDFYRQSWFLDLPKEIQDKSIWWMPLDVIRKSEGINYSYIKQIKNLYFITKHASDIVDVNSPKIIPHSINIEFFKPIEKKLNNKFIICRVDRHQPRKQWPYALDAYSIFSKDKNVLFLAKCNPQDHCGRDPDTWDWIDLEEFSNRVKIDKSKIRFIKDYSSLEYIRKEIYDISHCFLTTTGSEGFGLGVVEAMARGCIPIYPEGSSLPEATGNNGYRYKYGEIRVTKNLFCEYGRPDVNIVSKTLTNAYVDWKNSPFDFNTISEGCREHVEKNYHPDIIYKKWDKEINNILNIKSSITIKKKLNKNEIEYSIIIVTKNKFNILKDCLDSIILKTREKYEIIIVNNCSDEQTKIDIENYISESSFTEIKLLNNEIEGGFTYANNIGIKEAIGKHICLLNNDTVILSNKWLDIAKNQMIEDGARLIGPSRCFLTLAKNEYEIPNSIRELNVIYKGINDIYCCDFTGFWFVLADSNLFKNMPLNEDIKSYFADDADYCLRLTKNNIKWTCLSNQYNDGNNLILHLREQSRDLIHSEHRTLAMNEFFDSWNKKEKVIDMSKSNEITITIPTRNRPKYLIDILDSILNQKYKNWKLLICNDGDPFASDVLLKIEEVSKTHEIKVINGMQRGPMYAHELLWRNSNTEWIFRIDDDNILDSYCLAYLVCDIDDSVGAIAPLVLSPFIPIEQQIVENIPPKVEISNFMSAATVQQKIWINYDNIIPAEHLHSCFMYRKSLSEKIGGFIYSTETKSNVSFGEETIFTYKINKLGHKLLINQKSRIFHYVAENGGTRDNGLSSYQESRDEDYKIFMNSIREIYDGDSNG